MDFIRRYFGQVGTLADVRERAGRLFILGVGGGYTRQAGDHVVVVPTVDPDLVTPHAEAFQAVIWHCLVSHPALRTRKTKW